MRLHVLLVSLILLVLVQSTSYSQSSELLTRITADDGLSQNLVFDSLQDHQGFIWFGTKDGLSRYDGHDFRIYKTDPSSRQSLAGNYVTLTYQDSDLNFWVETRPGGLHIYDPLMDHFTRLSDLTGQNEQFYNTSAWVMYGSNRTGWWAATQNGLYHITPGMDATSRVTFDPDLPSNVKISSIALSKDGDQIYFSTANNGIYRLNTDTHSTEPAFTK